LTDEVNREALRIEVGTSISLVRLAHILSKIVAVFGKLEAICLDDG